MELCEYPVGRTPWTGDRPVTRPLYLDIEQQKQKKSKLTLMPSVGLEACLCRFPCGGPDRPELQLISQITISLLLCCCSKTKAIT
jgi:hypothetical protein